MSYRNQWLQGLQWGAYAWLGWVTYRYAADALGARRCCLLLPPIHGIRIEAFTVAAVWVAALLMTWTRWSRIGIMAAVGLQAVRGTLTALGYGGELQFWWTLTFWLPMSLPLIPLLFMEPERPRYTFALLLVGRWRDALAQLAGWRWPLVAAALLMLNQVGWTFLYGMQGGDPAVEILRAFETPAVLLAVAAIPRLWAQRRAC